MYIIRIYLCHIKTSSAKLKFANKYIYSKSCLPVEAYRSKNQKPGLIFLINLISMIIVAVDDYSFEVSRSPASPHLLSPPWEIISFRFNSPLFYICLSRLDFILFLAQIMKLMIIIFIASQIKSNHPRISILFIY